MFRRASADWYRGERSVGFVKPLERGAMDLPTTETLRRQKTEGGYTL
jgi:hypothetical protein